MLDQQGRVETAAVCNTLSLLRSLQMIIHFKQVSVRLEIKRAFRNRLSFGVVYLRAKISHSVYFQGKQLHILLTLAVYLRANESLSWTFPQWQMTFRRL